MNGEFPASKGALQRYNPKKIREHLGEIREDLAKWVERLEGGGGIVQPPQEEKSDPVDGGNDGDGDIDGDISPGIINSSSSSSSSSASSRLSAEEKERGRKVQAAREAAARSKAVQADQAQGHAANHFDNNGSVARDRHVIRLNNTCLAPELGDKAHVT